MLTLPAHTTLAGFTAYPDDQRWWRYHVVPVHPRLRIGADGLPVFHFLRYRHSDVWLAAHPDAPLGGGVISLEVDLAPTSDAIEALRVALQPEVDADWERLRRGSMHERAQAMEAGQRSAPAVEVVAANFIDATLEIVSTQDEHLIEAISAPTVGRLSDNVVYSELRCTPHGASLFQALLEEDGALPIQLRLQLTMLARMPDVTVRVAVDSERLHRQVRIAIEGSAGAGLLRRNTVGGQLLQHEVLELDDAVRVEIDVGSATTSPEVITALREQAWSKLEQVVEDRLLVDDEGGFKLLGLAQVRSLHLGWEVAQRDVVSWRLAPSGLIEGALTALPADRRVTTLLLDQEALQSDVEIAVRVTAPLGPGTTRLDVELDHHGHGTTLLFTAEGTQLWRAPLTARAPAWRWRTRSHHATRGPQAWGPWSTSESNSLPIFPEPSSTSTLRLLGAWSSRPPLDRVEVSLREEPSGRINTITLLADQREATTPLPTTTSTFSWRPTWVLADGGVWEGTWELLGHSTELLIKGPPVDQCSLTLIPTGAGWEELDMAIVDIDRDETSTSIAARRTVQLPAHSAPQTVELALPRGATHQLRLRMLARFRDGRILRTDWTVNDGRIAPLHIPTSGRRHLTLLGQALDFDAAPRTVVRATFPDGTSQDVTFTAAITEQIPWPTAVRGALILQVTHHPRDRAPVILAPAAWDGDAWLIPPHRLHRRTIRVLGALLDRDKVVSVEVDLMLQDEHGQHQTHTLLVSPGLTATWSVVSDSPTGALSTRRRWTLRDGPREEDWQTNPTSSLVLPPVPP
jgi:hypothetical protein